MTTKAYILIETAVGKSGDVSTALRALSDIQTVDAVTGPYDIIAIISASDLNAVGEVVTTQIHTIGGVISPGSAVLSIVPQEASLVFAVRIDPSQIDRVHATQAAEIRFPSFNARTTPSFPAEVRTVAPDVVTDPNSGISYFTAELRVPEAERETLLTLGLQPGMPLEAFIQTGARSPGSILLKPVTDYMSYALREE